MELTFYIRLETPPKGANHAKNFGGLVAAKNWDKLTAAARELGIKPLQDFVSIGEKELNALGKKVLGNAVVVKKERWFPAHEGLTTIRKLISRVSQDKHGFEKTRMLVRDLQSYENILSAAEARGSRFHFSPDFEPDKPVEEV
jgi:hypothetical protein